MPGSHLCEFFFFPTSFMFPLQTALLRMDDVALNGIIKVIMLLVAVEKSDTLLTLCSGLEKILRVKEMNSI